MLYASWRQVGSSISTRVNRFLHTQLLIPLIVRLFDDIVGNYDETLEIHFTDIGKTVKVGAAATTKMAADGAIRVRLIIHNAWSLFRRLASDARVGLAEAYMDGEWDADPSPKQFLSFLIRAKQKRKSNLLVVRPYSKTLLDWLLCLAKTLSAFPNKSNWPLGLTAFIVRPLLLIWRAIASPTTTAALRNTIKGSQANIREHYDIGNELFALFLDKSMTYSCPIFDEKNLEMDAIPTDAELYEAQRRKNDAVLDLLEITSGQRVLEVGCGWGSLALAALDRQPSCRWIGLTLSNAQLQYARLRVANAQLQDRVRLELLDYREATGVYDHVVAVEMIEAVGHDFLPLFFRMMADRVRVGGKIVIQSIICPDETYDRYRQSDDFIKKHIFPGGHLPSLGAIREALPPKLTLVSVRHIGRHYAPALDAWGRKWLDAQQEICARFGRSQRFFRQWEMYFSLCAALFQYGNIDNVQLLLVKT